VAVEVVQRIGGGILKDENVKMVIYVSYVEAHFFYLPVFIAHCLGSSKI
jgi:hypothetical protein